MAEPEIQDQEVPSESVGLRLRSAREAAGMSLADISSRTKIAERYLVAIEEDRFSDLASRTYAVGFSRSYARAVGLNDGEIADAVREALSAEEESWPVHQLESFEPGDPARLPPARLAWIAGLGVLAVIVLVIMLKPSFLFPAGELPDLTSEDPAPATSVAAPEPVIEESSAIDPDGDVVFTALEDAIWVKFYDARGRQLFQKQMAQGESFTIPSDAEGPQIWTGRPDAFEITIGGKQVPKLSEDEITVKDRLVTAAALLAREEKPADAEAGVQAPSVPVATTRRAPSTASPTTQSTVSSRRASSPTSSTAAPVQGTGTASTTTSPAKTVASKPSATAPVSVLPATVTGSATVESPKPAVRKAPDPAPTSAASSGEASGDSE